MKKRLFTIALVLCLVLTLVPVSALAAKGNATFPRSATAYMKIKFSCGCQATGTGGMVCSDGMVTAGHNVICKTHNQPASSITFYFGYVADDDYLYKYTGKFTPYAFCDFANGYSMENDIAILKFPKKIGENTGWYASQNGSAYDYDGQKGFICTYGENGEELFYSGRLSAYDNSHVAFEHKALPEGASGSPVYIERGTGRATALIGVYCGCEDNNCIGTVVTWDVMNKMVEELSMVLL